MLKKFFVVAAVFLLASCGTSKNFKVQSGTVNEVIPVSTQQKGQEKTVKVTIGFGKMNDMLTYLAYESMRPILVETIGAHYNPRKPIFQEAENDPPSIIFCENLKPRLMQTLKMSISSCSIAELSDEKA